MPVRLTTLCENTVGALGFSGEWGLSILVEAGGEAVLLDAGLGDAVVKNADVGGVDLGKISKVVISHGHADHTGGLRPLLRRLGKQVEVYGHPAMWDKKYAYVKPPAGGTGRYRYIGVPYCREELEGLGASFVLHREPVWLNENMVVTGEVPMTTSFEQVDDNMFVNKDGDFVPDELPDDRALVVKTAKGLVVVLGCAHRGMVNTLLHAREITGVQEIYAVVGGTHLIRAKEDQLRETVEALRRLGVARIGVSHCTGLAAAALLAREFGAAFFFNNAGTVVDL